MNFPGEELIGKAIEQISSGIQLKLSQIEEQRNRDFTQQIKELEYYKSNYEKDLKDIFNYWFDLVRVLHIKDNPHLSEQEKRKYENKYKELTKVDKMAKYKINTIKYGGKETCRVLALESTLNNNKYSEHSKQAEFFVWCELLSALKKDVLGQDTDALDIIRVLVNDLYDNNNYDLINKAKEYVIKIYKEIYDENPYWK